MGGFLKLSGVSFTGGNMPRIVDPIGDILALPGLISWHTAQAEYITEDTGRVANWANRISGRPAFISRGGANKPIFDVDDQGIYFENARSDVLDYDATYPNGAGVASTAVLIGLFPSSGSSTFWYHLAADGASTANRFALGSNNAFVRGICDNSQPFATVSSTPASRRVIGISHDADADTLKAYADGAINEAANTDIVALPGVSLGYAAASAQSPTMTVRDVLIFDRDVITFGSEAMSAIEAYAATYEA